MRTLNQILVLPWRRCSLIVAFCCLLSHSGLLAGQEILSLPVVTANEAFTEPIESIQVASPEFGIVSLVNVTRGDRVQSEELLVELDTKILRSSLRLAEVKANAKARQKAAQVDLDNKVRRHQNMVELINENAGSPQEVEKAQTEVEVARQEVEAVREELEQFRLEAARIETQLDQRRIRSPISGIVTEVRKKPGEYVSANDPHLVTVVRLDQLRIVFYIPTSQAEKISPGDGAEILLVDRNQRVPTDVDYVAPVTNADSGRVRVDVILQNPELQFRSGIRCRLVRAYPKQPKVTRIWTGALTQDR